MTDTTVGLLFSRLRARGTATFRHGVAWDTPMLTTDGLRGVGVTDFERGVTRVVQIGFPRAVRRQIEGRRSRNPLRRWGFRTFAAALRRAGVAREILFERESVWLRDDERGGWEEVPAPEATDLRPLANDPTWILQPLVSATGAARSFIVDAQMVKASLPREIMDELGLDRTSRSAEIEFDVTLAEDGVPRRIGVLLPTGRRTSGQMIWEVLEFTGYGLPFDQVDLWHAWHQIQEGS
jgi:hypothetical protein